MTEPPYSVVIVDDVAQLRSVIARILQRSRRFEVVGEASNGLEGIAVVRESQPDLVLLDIAMPVCDGLQALPQILEAAPHTVVAMLSAFEAGEVEQSALDRGASTYLEKGMSPQEMTSRLLELMDRRDERPTEDDVTDR